MALVSYDQVAHEDDNNWSLGYITIVGAYVLKGTRHDVSTLVDLAVVDPATRSLVLRAGGFDTRHGTVALIDENRRLRESAAEGFNAATQQMIDHFDGALTAFEADVREGKANVKVVSNHGRPSSGGGGSIDWLALLFLASVATEVAQRRSDAHQNGLRPSAYFLNEASFFSCSTICSARMLVRGSVPFAIRPLPTSLKSDVGLGLPDSVSRSFLAASSRLLR